MSKDDTKDKKSKKEKKNGKKGKKAKKHHKTVAAPAPASSDAQPAESVAAPEQPPIPGAYSPGTTGDTEQNATGSGDTPPASRLEGPATD